MLRLSPSSICSTIRPRLPSASPARSASSQVHVKWQPGQPLVLAASQEMRRNVSLGSQEGNGKEREREKGDAREWAPGDAIRFGGAEQGAASAGEQSTSTITPSTPSSTPVLHPAITSASLPPPPLLPSASSSHSQLPPSASVISTSVTGASGATLSQQELDDLVAGVDFADIGEEEGEFTSLSEDGRDWSVEIVGGSGRGGAAAEGGGGAVAAGARAGKVDLPQTELEELLGGIDFSQDLELSDLEEASAGMDAGGGADGGEGGLRGTQESGGSSDSKMYFIAPLARPATPPSTAKTGGKAKTRLIVRHSPVASTSSSGGRPVPSSPTQADLFSPSSASSTSAVNQTRRSPSPSSTLLAAASTARPPSPIHLRSFSYASTSFSPSSSTASTSLSIADASPVIAAVPVQQQQQKPKKQIIDLSNSPSSPPAPTAPRRAHSGSGCASTIRRQVQISDDEDDEIEILSVLRRVQRETAVSIPASTLGASSSAPIPSSSKPSAPKLPASQAKAGWFEKPAHFNRLPSSSLLHTSTTSSSAPAPATSPEPPYASRPSYVSRGSKPTKRQAADAKQSKLRERWPIEFRYEDQEWAFEEEGGKGGEGGRGKVRVVCTADEAVVERELGRMKGPLAFDLEWNPFVRGKDGVTRQGKTALAQVCDRERILLVHVAKMRRFPPALKELIEDGQRIKLGVQIAGDAQKLVRDFSFRPAGCLELNALVRSFDPSRLVNRPGGLIGLQELTGIYLERYLPKEASVRCGKWNLALGEEQIRYAANDVFASLHVLFALERLAPKPVTHADLVSMSSQPYIDGYAASRAAQAASPPSDAPPPLALPVVPAPPGTLPSAILPPRKLEAYALFTRRPSPLSVAEIAVHMSTTLPIKELSVVWNLLESVRKLRAKEVVIEGEEEVLRRLVEEAEGLEGEWTWKFKEENGKFVEELREGLK